MHTPLSLYIHIPWCVKKCPYCDFNSHTLPTQAPFGAYVDALIADAGTQAQLAKGRAIHSIFIGGGTPSLLPINEYARLFDGLRKWFHIGDIEITMEANAGTLEHAPFEQYLALGINRLSIGVQSFDDSVLAILGRVHTGDEAKNAISRAKNAGFKRINIDLMHGLPKQTASKACADIYHAYAYGATHISWYQLTIEPNTAFFRTPPDLPNEHTLDAIEQDGRTLLQNLGYRQYEVSAYVGQDVPCAHNVNYWQFGDYLAIGAGAHGKISMDGAIYRYQKTRAPKDYLKNQAHNLSAIDRHALPSEFMLNALRLTDGVPSDLFARTGLDLTVIAPILQKLRHQGLMINDLARLQTTPLGARYLNQVMTAFL